MVCHCYANYLQRWLHLYDPYIVDQYCKIEQQCLAWCRFNQPCYARMYPTVWKTLRKREIVQHRASVDASSYRARSAATHNMGTVCIKILWPLSERKVRRICLSPRQPTPNGKSYKKHCCPSESPQIDHIS